MFWCPERHLHGHSRTQQIFAINADRTKAQFKKINLSWGFRSNYLFAFYFQWSGDEMYALTSHYLMRHNWLSFHKQLWKNVLKLLVSSLDEFSFKPLSFFQHLQISLKVLLLASGVMLRKLHDFFDPIFLHQCLFRRDVLKSKWVVVSEFPWQDS